MSVPPFNTNSAQPTLSQFDSDLSLSVEVMTPFVTLANSIDSNPNDYDSVSAAVQAYNTFLNNIGSGPLLAQIEANPGLSSAFQGAQAAANTGFSNFQFTTNPLVNSNGQPASTFYIGNFNFNNANPTVDFNIQILPQDADEMLQECSSFFSTWFQPPPSQTDQAGFAMWLTNGRSGSPYTFSSPNIVASWTASGGIDFQVNGVSLSTLLNSGAAFFGSPTSSPMTGLQNFLNSL